jgi:hypothetical protein
MRKARVVDESLILRRKLSDDIMWGIWYMTTFSSVSFSGKPFNAPDEAYAHIKRAAHWARLIQQEGGR